MLHMVIYHHHGGKIDLLGLWSRAGNKQISSPAGRQADCSTASLAGNLSAYYP